jgi:hypothetical protein
MTTEAIAEPVPRWDGRVLNGDGKPAPRYQLPWSRGWFVIRRADGPDGVVLETRIPGYLTGTAQHGDQAAAEAAARGIWRAYAADVTVATGRTDNGQENGPWTN